MIAPAFIRILWVLAGLALILGRTSDAFLARLPAARPLKQIDSSPETPWLKGGFKLSGAYLGTEAGLLPKNIPHAGSWIDGDSWEGNTETAWFAVEESTVRVGVAGYPQLPGCRLQAEFRRKDGKVTSLDCPLPNAHERWSVWTIHTPHDAIALRLVAEDRTGGHGGWVAFSMPFTHGAAEAISIYQFLQIVATTALALWLVWAPGSLWLARFQRRRTERDATDNRPISTSPWDTVILIGAGPLILAVLGVLLWCTSAWVRPQTTAAAAVAAVWLVTGFLFWRMRFRLPLGATLSRVLLLSAIVTVAVVAKSFYSAGPQGELFRGTISRNFEMTDRIDSRYSFYIAQAAAHHWKPTSPEAEKFFAPWTFFSRGPLAGLAATTTVFATNGKPPDILPENRWTPYDPTGFAAYRITMIALASSILVALFLVLGPIVGERWAFIAAGLVALSPFGIHEMMFTWPKWAATAWLVASFGLAHARRPLGAGIALGVGFMFHPLVLLWSPWLALWVAIRSERRAGALIPSLFKIAAGSGVVVLPWMAMGALAPHLSTTPLPGQIGFLHYWARADWEIAHWDNWWRTRWMNFANTFLPLHLYLNAASFNHPKLSSAYELSSRLVRFSEQWWNALPFALGLGLWAASLVTLARAMRALLAPLSILLIGPSLFIVSYWGMDPLGLMRECGHPLFVTVIGMTCFAASRHGGWPRTLLEHRAAPWLQLPETWLMLWLTTLLNSVPLAVEYDWLDPLYLAINTLALFTAAWVVCRTRMTAPLPQTSSVVPQPVGV